MQVQHTGESIRLAPRRARAMVLVVEVIREAGGRALEDSAAVNTGLIVVATLPPFHDDVCRLAGRCLHYPYT